LASPWVSSQHWERLFCRSWANVVAASFYDWDNSIIMYLMHKPTWRLFCWVEVMNKHNTRSLLEIQRMREIVVDQSPYEVEAISMWPFCVPTSGVVFVHNFNAFSILIQKTRTILKFGSAWIFTSDLLLLGYNWFFFLSWLLNFAAVSALQVIQQSTSLDLEWEDNSRSNIFFSLWLNIIYFLLDFYIKL